MDTRLRRLVHDLQIAGRFAGYLPDFHIEEFQPGHWWVLDGDIKVGLIVRGMDFAELVNFDPYQPVREVSFPRIYHAPTMPGDRITLAKWVNAQSTTSVANDIAFEEGSGLLTAVFTETWANGRTAYTRATWSVDPDYGYVLSCEAEMRSPEPEVHEYCNFLPKGTTDDRPGFARYPYILWEHPSGKIIRWNQNNVSARTLGALDLLDRRRIRAEGFIGFFGEQDRNAVVEILESTPGSTAGTCPNMLDEHIAWVAGANDGWNRDDTGAYLCRAVYRLLSVPPAVGDALTAQAEMLDEVTDRIAPELEANSAWCEREYPRVAGRPKDLAFPMMVAGKITDFSVRLDAADTFRGGVFPYLDAVDDPRAAIAIVDDCGHAGVHSLRIHVNGDTRQATPYGNCFHVTEGRRHRLSAWIKTDLCEGQACLRAHEFLYSPGNTTELHDAPPLTGTTDWQYVSVEFIPGERAHVVMPIIDASGTGTVWVDEVLLEAL